MVPRKEVRKYQNDPYSGNQTIRDLGGCERKNRPNNNEDEFKGQGYRVGSDDPNNRDNGNGGGDGSRYRRGRNGDGRDNGED